jgi:hypothetical protein
MEATLNEQGRQSKDDTSTTNEKMNSAATFLNKRNCNGCSEFQKILSNICSRNIMSFNHWTRKNQITFEISTLSTVNSDIFWVKYCAEE